MKIPTKTSVFPVLIVLALLQNVASACEVCEAQQPKILRGITHGAGPQGNSDYVIVGAAAVMVVFTLIYAIKLLVKPGERKPGHIKRTILEESNHGA